MLFKKQDDDLNTARGFLNAGILSAVAWVLIGFAMLLFAAGCTVSGMATQQAAYLCGMHGASVERLVYVNSVSSIAVCSNGLRLEFEYRTPAQVSRPSAFNNNQSTEALSI